MIISPVNKQVFSCAKCNVFFSDEQQEALLRALPAECSFCGTKNQQESVMKNFDSLRVKIHPQDGQKERLENISNVFWYHATLKKDWETEVNDKALAIHAGDFLAAQERIEHLSEKDKTKYTIYKLKITISTSSFAIVEDEEFYHPEPEKNRGFVYLNSWENAGSYSIIVKPTSFIIVEKTKKLFLKQENKHV